MADTLQKQKKEVIDLFRKKGLIRKEKEETKNGFQNFKSNISSS